MSGEFRCPVVLVLRSAFSTVKEVNDMVGRASVVVATAQALAGCPDAVRTRMVELCERLLIDEAHHVAARTWRSVADLFSKKEIVQITATPYREDGQHLGGKVAYAYPLRLAQKNGYFARINYRSVIDLTDPDRAIVSAIARLRVDLDGGLDHLMMARVSIVARAKEVIGIYEDLPQTSNRFVSTRALAPQPRQKRRDALFSP